MISIVLDDPVMEQPSKSMKRRRRIYKRVFQLGFTAIAGPPGLSNIAGHSETVDFFHDLLDQSHQQAMFLRSQCDDFFSKATGLMQRVRDLEHTISSGEFLSQQCTLPLHTGESWHDDFEYTSLNPASPPFVSDKGLLRKQFAYLLSHVQDPRDDEFDHSQNSEDTAEQDDFSDVMGRRIQASTETEWYKNMISEFPAVWGDSKFDDWLQQICCAIDKGDAKTIVAPFFSKEHGEDYAELFLHLVGVAREPEEHVASTALKWHREYQYFWAQCEKKFRTT
eukprot:gnl/MRDRNA2_/MRDRNA2_133111_c0_seq1.p1 gnl/MRDRNA2_/MRDRNA2_133111_c0~~gnl/MRDRNA2_/MRDRNA2_133111_c0_seq1.p1  ORF type:complete len:280 (+),score=43.99 gnl/MRDRNA2_/MRDRNA2_133111_c0_seq1:156-995(+)